MKKLKISGLAGLALAAIVILIVAGCESISTSDTTIIITPSSATLSGAGASQVFTASGTDTNSSLALPLEWSVTDPSKGNIVASGGSSAVYYSNGAGGSNVIKVRDQGESEGVATVIQE